ncbi:MFS transporter [Glacieibacterium frigidum]|nr:MFS transporter [Glacieibacterium frigidum]
MSKARLPVRAEDISLTRRVAAFAFILLGYIFYSYAWNTIDVLRPYIRASAGLTLTEAGLLYSFQSAGALVGAVVVGQMADRFGRRNLLAAITLGYGVALLAGVFAHDFVSLAAQRLVLGIFLGGVFAVAVGLYVGLFDAQVRGRLASIVGATFGLGLALQGWLGGFYLDNDWTVMLWAGAVPPIVLALFTFVVIPDDRHVIPYGGAPEAPVITSKMPARELFAPEHRRTTLLLTLLSGLGFLGYQGFSGWVTTFLKDVRGFSGADMGALIAWQAVGGILGGFFWGWVADRFGRRAGILGFVIGSAIIIAYLRAPAVPALLGTLGAAYGFVMSSGIAWGPYFTELYPSHLRSTAASVFHWGRIIGFLAPAITVAVADVVGLTAAMMMAALVYLAAALVWWLLPETLVRRRA